MPSAWTAAAGAAHRLQAGRTGRPRVACPRPPVLVVGAHPDDEALAAGGTIAPIAGRAGRLSAAIEHWAVRTRAATILAPWADDGHADHKAVHRGAALVAGARRIALWGGEVWTPLPASHLVDIGGAPLERKGAALAAYTTAGTVLQLEAILGLNRYRALAATPGCVAAEAFAVTAPG